jgi:hypothetical protein
VEREKLAMGNDRTRLHAQAVKGDDTEERAAMIRLLKQSLLPTILLVL